MFFNVLSVFVNHSSLIGGPRIQGEIEGEDGSRGDKEQLTGFRPKAVFQRQQGQAEADRLFSSLAIALARVISARSLILT